MTDETTPDALPSPEFPSALRGYDRAAVDAHVRKLQVHLVDLEAQLAASGTGVEQDPGDQDALRHELETIASEVGAILEAARAAAENMRARAAEDAARWRADADRESREMRENAERDSETARGDAWETSTTMLDQASHEAATLLESARQDALYIRAEAEREAVRLTGDARRDSEEAVRAGKNEADRLKAVAQSEAQTTTDNARRSAELAQERARALERRRGELMEELELARRSIGEIEESQAPVSPATPDDGGQSSPAVAPASEKSPSEWLDSDASVKIVPATKLPPEEPVDTDSFLAEVEQFRTAPPPPEPAPETTGAGAWLDVLEEAEEPAEDEAPAATPGPLAPEKEPEFVDAKAETPADEILSLDSEPEEPQHPDGPEELHRLPDPDEPEGVSTEVEVSAVRPAAAEEEVTATEPAEVPESDDGLDSLFATLREPVDKEPTPNGSALVPAALKSDAGERTAAAKGSAGVSSSGPEEAEPAVEPLAVESAAAVDPFDLKERMLLPIENRSLRSVKRRIVDLQNRVLEELRLGDDDWQPDRALYAAAVGDEVAVLTQESYVAGYAAAAELVGEAATPPPDRAADQDTTSDFVDAALAATSEALNKARATGGGARQVSAAVSRVFRAWRTDEAERRLRATGARAYHAGILDALPGLGAADVAAIARGTPCGRCPASTGASWKAADGLPAGTELPPAVAACTATIVPVAGD